MLNRCAIFICLIVTVSLFPIQAQWVRAAGASGYTSVSSFAVSESYIFTGTSYGVYRTKLHETRWVLVHPSIGWSSITSLAAIDTEIYFGNALGIYRSSDNGNTWIDINNGQTRNQVYSLIIVRTENGYNIFSAQYGGVFRSNDKGSTWVPVDSVLLDANANVKALAVHQRTGGTSNILAGSSSQGIYLSNNGGRDWIQKNHGLTNMDVRAFAVTDSNIYTLTYNGIFQSSDNGENWIKLSSGGGNSIAAGLSTTSEISLFIGTTYYGVYRSTNNGGNWKNISIGLPKNCDVDEIFTFESNIFIGTNYGIYFSSDNGSSWIDANDGLPGYVVNTVFKKNNSLLFAGTRNGVFKSTNNGEVWSVSNSGVEGIDIRVFAIDSSNTNEPIIFAGSQAAGLYRSTNNGTNWTNISSTPSSYADLVIYSHSIGEKKMFAATHGPGVLISTDNGVSWESKNNGLTNLDIYTLIFCPNGSGSFNLLAGTGPGKIFLSSDFGENWNMTTTNIPIYSGIYTFALLSDKEGKINVLAGTHDSKILLSTDQGNSWNVVAANVNSTQIHSFLVVQDGSGTSSIFAGTAWGSNSGILLSIDEGKTWKEVSDNLNAKGINIYSIIMASNNQNETFIIAGSEGPNGLNGIWRRRLSDIITSVSTYSADIPTHYKLSQNYPNPFNPTTTIEFSLPQASNVTLKVFDVLGREVKILVDEKKFAGSYTVQFDGNDLSSGMYFYQLQTKEFSQVKKLLLLK